MNEKYFDDSEVWKHLQIQVSNLFLCSDSHVVIMRKDLQKKESDFFIRTLCLEGNEKAVDVYLESAIVNDKVKRTISIVTNVGVSEAFVYQSLCSKFFTKLKELVL